MIFTKLCVAIVVVGIVAFVNFFSTFRYDDNEILCVCLTIANIAFEVFITFYILKLKGVI